MSDKSDVEMELLLLRRDFEACRQHSCEREDRYTAMMSAYRAEVVRIGDDAATIARETKSALGETLAMLRRDVEALLEILVERNGKAPDGAGR
jgi:hypothetical protein